MARPCRTITGLAPVMRWLAALALSVALAAGLRCAGRAQSIESMLSPGKLIQGHAEVGDDCNANATCKFDRKAQDRLVHGLPQGCRRRCARQGRFPRPDEAAGLQRSCHTDHKGRDAQIVELDKKKFDHALTDYALRGKHDKTECDKCHEPAKKYRAAPAGLQRLPQEGRRAQGCAGRRSAPTATPRATGRKPRFDHDKTRFALTGKHVDAKCADCHKNNDYKDTPRPASAATRRTTTAARATRASTARSARAATTPRPGSLDLQPRHRHQVRAARQAPQHQVRRLPHRPPLQGQAEPGLLRAATRRTTSTRTALGKDCGSCHTERDWKEPAKFDHDKTDFPLLGKHVEVECKDCHKSTMFKEAPKDCFGCHKKDDKHEGTLGEAVRRLPRRAGLEDHQGPLRPRQDQVPAAQRARRAEAEVQRLPQGPEELPQDAAGLLQLPQEGRQARGPGRQAVRDLPQRPRWKDHALRPRPDPLPADWASTSSATCKNCHETPRYKDAPRDCYGCHKKEDKHKLEVRREVRELPQHARLGDLGLRPRQAQPSYKLDGAHRKVACESCHTQPAPARQGHRGAGQQAASSCHRKDDVHDGSFGARCEQCHVTDNWKTISQPRRAALPRPTRSRPRAGRCHAETGSRFTWQAERPGSHGAAMTRRPPWTGRWRAAALLAAAAAARPQAAWRRARGHAQLRPPEDRLRADRRARQRALRVLPRQRRLQGHAARLRQLPRVRHALVAQQRRQAAAAHPDPAGLRHLPQHRRPSRAPSSTTSA